MFASALKDVGLSLSIWRVWLLLGWEDIAKQYRRTLLGPVWLTLASFIMIFAFGYIWSQLFKQSINTYLPYVAVGHVIFIFINASVIDSCSTYTANESYLKQLPVPKFGFAIRVVIRNLIIFLHNIPVIIIVFMVFSVSVGDQWWLAVPIFMLASFNAILLGASMGALCARFRDIPMVISNAMQVLFFLTPILWMPEQVTEQARVVVDFNPLAAFLIMIRNPILGLPVTDAALNMVIFATLFNFAIFILWYSWSRSKIVYWL